MGKRKIIVVLMATCLGTFGTFSEYSLLSDAKASLGSPRASINFADINMGDPDEERSNESQEIESLDDDIVIGPPSARVNISAINLDDDSEENQSAPITELAPTLVSNSAPFNLKPLNIDPAPITELTPSIIPKQRDLSQLNIMEPSIIGDESDANRLIGSPRALTSMEKVRIDDGSDEILAVSFKKADGTVNINDIPKVVDGGIEKEKGDNTRFEFIVISKSPTKNSEDNIEFDNHEDVVLNESNVSKVPSNSTPKKKEVVNQKRTELNIKKSDKSNVNIEKTTKTQSIDKTEKSKITTPRNTSTKDSLQVKEPFNKVAVKSELNPSSNETVSDRVDNNLSLNSNEHDKEKANVTLENQDQINPNINDTGHKNSSYELVESVSIPIPDISENEDSNNINNKEVDGNNVDATANNLAPYDGNNTDERNLLDEALNNIVLVNADMVQQAQEFEFQTEKDAESSYDNNQSGVVFSDDLNQIQKDDDSITLNVTQTESSSNEEFTFDESNSLDDNTVSNNKNTSQIKDAREIKSNDDIDSLEKNIDRPENSDVSNLAETTAQLTEYQENQNEPELSDSDVLNFALSPSLALSELKKLQLANSIDNAPQNEISAQLVEEESTSSVVNKETTHTKELDLQSYVVGVSYGQGIKKEFVDGYSLEIDRESMLKGVEDALNSKVAYTQEEMDVIYNELNAKIQQNIEQNKLLQADLNKQKGDRFRAFYAQQSDVKHLPSGLLYRIILTGDKHKPTIDSLVTVRYVGKLLDGTIFEQMPEPIQVPLSGLVPSWKEGLPMIGRGGRIELVVPPEMGFGDKETRGIPGNSTLIFEIELLDVQP